MLNPKISTTWGTDPEGFFERKNQIIGSERLIPEEGLITGQSKIIRDGVQFELNPANGTTVRQLGMNISVLFQALRETLRRNPDVALSFDGLVEVSQKELDSLSPATRILGCMPSFNIYGVKPIDVDPIAYRKRSSGGHIHMGLTLPIFDPFLGDPDNRQRLVPLMDIFVGAFSVLLDRDPGAAERRENYGRAGEFRLPKYGLEYRTTSNFWLRDYRLMSFTFGMAQIAISVLAESLSGKDIEEELIQVVDIAKVIQAINTNDFDLALEHVRAVTPFLQKYLPDQGFIFNPQSIGRFPIFAQEVRARGIERYFPTEAIVDTWCNERYEDFTTFLQRF
jgi:hypothetical protein